MSESENNLTDTNDSLENTTQDDQSKNDYQIVTSVPDHTNELSKFCEDFSNYLNFNHEHDEQV